MLALALRNIRKQFGLQVVLDDISFELHSGETVGLVGPNGCGKTTICGLITGELQPELGTVQISKGVTVGLLRQESELGTDGTLIEEVGEALADIRRLEMELHQWSQRMATGDHKADLDSLMASYEQANNRFIAAGGHGRQRRLYEVLGGLGFCERDHALPIQKLSGGQKCRAALAKLLVGDPSFLLLDEPSNHLDMDAVEWLEGFLKNHPGGVMIISHDRYLLDRVCTRIFELEHRRLTCYRGNYTNFVKNKEVLQLTQQRQFEKDMEFIKKERAFIAKHLAGQRTREAQGRRTRLERRLKAGEFTTEDVLGSKTTNIKFSRSEAGTETVIRAQNLSMSFGDFKLFSQLSFQLLPRQRLGITGPNGTGKTTLLKILIGELQPTAGQVSLAPQLKVGYYAQEHMGLDPAGSVVETIRAKHPEFTEQAARSLLARYRFTGDDAFKLVGALSGGEHSRLRLALLILEEPDLLILDEPTNHLDISSCEALETALQEFDGTLVAVSHDRYFLDRVVNRLLILRHDSFTIHDGNYSSYIGETTTVSGVQSESNNDKVRRTQASGGKGRSKKKRVTKNKSSKATPSKYDPMPIEEIEALLIDRETALARLHERFGRPELYQDPDALAELREEADAAAAELAEIEAVWEDRLDTHQP